MLTRETYDSLMLSMHHTAGHMDNTDYAGCATTLSELCSKSDINYNATLR